MFPTMMKARLAQASRPAIGSQIADSLIGRGQFFRSFLSRRKPVRAKKCAAM